MAFDPTTAYADEYRYYDNVVDAVLIPRDVNGIDLDRHADVKAVEQELATSSFGSTGFASGTVVFLIWLLNTAENRPAQGFGLLTGEVEYAIHSVVHRQFDRLYECLCSTVGLLGVKNEL